MIIESLKSLAVPIDQLRGLPNNPRKGDVSAVMASLSRFGQRKPIVARRDDGTIIAGNHTWQAACELGWKEIAVAYVGDDDVTAQAYALADNRTAELGSYDDDLLRELIESVESVDPELLRDTGWDEASVAELLESLEKNQELPIVTEDEVPEKPLEAKTKTGDLYQIGKHRIICGSSGDVSVVERLLENKEPKIVFADPPYGIAYKAMRGGKDIANDSSFSEAKQTIVDSLSLFHKAEAVFACCDWRSLPMMIEAFHESALEPKACIVWDKQNRVQNLDRFGKQHEFILYAGPYGGQKTVGTDVWKYARDFEPDHPTPKPVGLISEAIEATTSRNDLVIDPFAGSGSTLVAAHQTGRIGYGIEIDPIYVDVIVERLEKATGEKAVLVQNAESA
jgi:site-specific DNA-methyltransferase (adenine-specific)